ERLGPLPDDPAQLLRLPLQLLLGKRREPLRNPVDLLHHGEELLHLPVVTRAEDLRKEILEHGSAVALKIVVASIVGDTPGAGSGSRTCAAPVGRRGYGRPWAGGGRPRFARRVSGAA